METQYEVIQAGEPKAPPRSLIRISGDRQLVASLDAFGPNYFNSNVAKMQEQYSHPQTGDVITFREPTTAESIIVASYDFTNKAKPQILDPRLLQLGRIVRTSEGVFANVPRDAQGNPVTDEKILKSLLKANKKVNGIYLLDKDIGYAPYGTFKQGVQDAGDFAESGLARVLEHSQSPKHLSGIASKRNYPRGVNVFGFDSVNQPVLKVASLFSYRYSGIRQLGVDGDCWCDDDGGCAFGVLDSAEGTAKKI
ncbi:MAG: hypothetical protein ABH840_02020 [Nanoarchaeota archaeon]